MRTKPARSTAYIVIISLLVGMFQSVGPWVSQAAAAPVNQGGQSQQAPSQPHDRPVEVQERRTPASKTFQNPDGTLTTSIFGKPIHYRDQNGQYQPIQNTLVAEAGGSVIHNAANRYKASFKNQLGPDFLTFEYAGRSMSMDLERARSQHASWYSNKLSYYEALDHVDLSYTMGNDFVKEDLVLTAPLSSPQFTFNLLMTGVRAETTDSGALQFVDETSGAVQWFMPRFFMRDAAGSMSSAVTADLRVTGKKARVTVTPDADWLNAPDRVYPVVIDPTIALQPDYVGGLDTTVADGQGLQDLNLGFDPALGVGNSYSSLLKFDLTAIPRASIISQATLTLNSISGLPASNSTGVPAPSATASLAVSSYTSAFGAGTYSVRYTYVTPQGETLGSPAATIAIADYQSIDVHAGSLPAGVTGIKVYIGAPGAEQLALTSDKADVTLTAPPVAGAAGLPFVPTTEPTLSVSSQYGYIAAGTYSVVYTYVTAQGETQASPNATVTVPGGKAIAVDVAALPAGVSQVKIYIGAVNDERYIATSSQRTVTVTNLPSSSAVRPPDPRADFIASPVVAPATAAVAAPTGATGFLGGTYYVRYTWVNSMGETTASPAQTVTLAEGQALQVTLGKMPVGVASANVYAGTSADAAVKLGNIVSSSGGSAVVFGNPPASLFKSGPAQSLSIIADPTVAPTVDRFTGTTAFVAGSYDVVYTFFGPNGESAASPITTVTLTAGDYVKVTAGQAVPSDTAGIRVYMGNHGAPLYLVGKLGAAMADSPLPFVTIKAPPGYQPDQPPTSSNETGPSWAPTLKAVNLTTPTRLEGATYYVAYTWVYPDAESRASSAGTVTIADGQGIDVTGSSLPGDALGMRVYMGRVSGNLSLVATSMGSRTVVEGDRLAPTAPQVNTTQPPAPAVEAITLSALAAGTYYAAYTLTNQTSESAPSPVASAALTAGQKLRIDLPPLPGGLGANIYLGLDQTNLQLVRATTSQVEEFTALPPANATPISQWARGPEPPAAPTGAPQGWALAASAWTPGQTVSVRYVPLGKGGAYSYAPSPAASVTVGVGQAVLVRVPDYLPGVTQANLYAGDPGAELRVGMAPSLGTSVIVTGPAGRAAYPAPTGSVGVPAAPTLTSASGGTLSGDVYVSYSFACLTCSGSSESLRSPEVFRTFAAPNGTAVVTTGPVPDWMNGVKVYVGQAPGEGRLYAAVPATAGSPVTVNVGRMPPAGIALHPVTSPWTELDATWVRSGANALWYKRGGDYSPELGIALENSGTQLTADVTSLARKWADGTLPNNGVILKGGGARVDYASSDNPDESLRPVLTVTYRVTQGPPRVRLTSPAAGSSLSGPVTLSASVTAPDPATRIDRVDFYVNGANVGTATKAPYTVTWSAANLPGGVYDVSARAYDQFGQEGVSNWSPIMETPFNDDRFNDPWVDSGKTTAQYDSAHGLYTLPVSTQTLSVSAESASSEKAAESYPAENLLDGKSDTYWRSPGQLTPDSYESVRFDLSGTTSGLSLSVQPRNPQDGLTVKAEAIDSTGEVVGESAVVVLSQQTQSVYVSGSRSFTSVRLVFSNLKRDLASGRYHAEVSGVSGYSGLKLAEGKSYHATYTAQNTVDGNPGTSWVSAGQSGPAGQEYLDLSLSGPANAFYIKPRTPGVTATIATFRSADATWAPVLTIASLDEGLYPLPPGITAEHIRLYMTNLVGITGPDAPSAYYGGVDELVPYQLAITSTQGTVQSKLVTLGAQESRFLLEADDSQPPGSRIDYQLYDGVQWRPISPGLELDLPAPTSTVTLQAVLSSASPLAVPTLSGWRLYAYGSRQFTLLTGTDTIPPTADLVYPATDWISGQAALNVATWDNVGVTKVDLYVDSAAAPAMELTKAPGDQTPYVFNLDTTTLAAGKHMMWVTAYDQAGNASASLPPTTTYQAYNSSFSYDAIDRNLSSHPVVRGSWVVDGTNAQSVNATGSGKVTQQFNAGEGLIELRAPAVEQSDGTCTSGYLQILLGSSTVAEDQFSAGACNERYLAYMATSPGTYTAIVSQDSTTSYKAAVTYPGQLSATAPYTTSTVVSVPTVTAGPLKSIKLQVNESKPTGTDIRYYVSANDGVTWQSVRPGEETQLNHGGRKLRLRADLVPGTSSGSTYANVTPQLNNWSATVTQFIPKQLITVSQVAPPYDLSAQLNGTAKPATAALQWKPSNTSGVTYNVYRSTTPHPEGAAYLVATGVAGNSLTESSNLLHNAGFENGMASWNAYSLYSYSPDTAYAVAGRQSLRVSDWSWADGGVYQTVTTSAAAGTTFSLAVKVKGQNVVETAPQAVRMTLYYSDNTNETAAGNIPGGTFDWTTARFSFTAKKQVSSVRVTLGLYGTGTLWFDAAQLDTKGATVWDDGDLDASKTYYYLVTAVDAQGRESAPSGEASTGAKATASGMLGIKSFWPYSTIAMPGGSAYVNMAGGNLAYTATDLVYPGRLLTTAFRRTYNAQAASMRTAMGYGWDHNFDWTLKPGTNGAQVLTEGDGSSFVFASRGDGSTFTSPSGARMSLVKQSDGTYTVARYDDNLLYEFDAGGRLTRIREPNGNALTLFYDGSNRLTKVTDPGGSAMTFTYNAAGLITQVTHPGSTSAQPRQVTFQYDARDNLVQVTDMENEAVYYGYDEDHRLVQWTNDAGHTTQVVYSGLPGVVQQVIFPDNATTTFAYGAVGDQTGWTKSTVTDARGFAVTYQVDVNGLLAKQSFPYGTSTPSGTSTGSVMFEHDAAWNVTKYTDPLGGVYTITYDGYGNILTVTDPLNSTTSNLWTLKPYPGAGGQNINVPAQRKDALGQVTSITTDSTGNVTQIEDPLLQVTSYTYDANGQRTAARDPNGHATTYSYDANGWLTAQTDAIGGTTRYSYDAGGNPSVITDPVGNQTRYTYDRVGRQTEIIAADGSTAFYLYDGSNNLIQSTDAGGAVTRYEYDNRERAVKATVWPNAGDKMTQYVTTYEYDSIGQPIAVTDARGKRSTVTYDGAGRRLSTTNAAGETTTNVYDAAGNMLGTTDPLGVTVTAEYDKLNRRFKTTIPQDSGGNLTQTVTFDALGRMASQKDGLGNTTTYNYDAVGRLIMVVDPMGFGTTYAYDKAGNRLAVTDAQRRTTQYVYDSANRVTEEKRPDGVSLFTRYDQAGRKIGFTNGNNQTIGYRYDNRSNLVEVTYPSGRNITYGYDAMGRRTSMTDWNGTTRYQYNLLGWLQQTEDPWGHEVRYTYDQAGNRTQMNLHYAGVDFTWAYQYDAANRMTSVQAPGVSRPDTVSYDKDGRMTSAAYANGDSLSQSYNRAGELTGINNTSSSAGTILNMSYAYDRGGNRTSFSASGEAAVGYLSLTYHYDADGRLTAAGPSWSSTSREYYYDLVGDRHTQVVNSGSPTGVTTFVYDPMNRLLEEFGPLPADQGGGRYHQSYTYDADGAQTRVVKDGKEVTLYYYDEESHLLQVTNPLGQITRYTYNGIGQRVRMEEPKGVTYFIYDGNEVLAEADATGTIKIAYTRGPRGRLISQWQGGETFWYHLDALGSTIALTDESGKIRNKYGYDEYGNLHSDTVEDVFNRFTYTGQAWDASVGLYNYKSRYYNPSVGRFLTQDTWKGSPWQPWTQNLYVYVGNNPVRYTDPTGHCLEDLCIGELILLFTVLAEFAPELEEALPAAEEAAPAFEEAAFEAEAAEATLTEASAEAETELPEITISRSKYPESAAHIEEAQAEGQPSELTIDRSGAASRRAASLKGVPTEEGMDRDEYPPAVTKEGGEGADVKHIPSSDNRGAGASMGAQMRDYPDGTRVRIKVVE